MNSSNNLLNEIINLYADGVSASSLATKFSVDKRQIIQLAKDLNIFRDKNLSHRTFQFNRDIFDNIDNEYKAFWLGFISATGYCHNRKLTISIDNDKKSLLNEFCKFISYPEDKITIKSNKKQSLELVVSDKYIAEKLFNIGFCKNIIPFPPPIPTSLLNCFLLGYFSSGGDIIYLEKTDKWSVIFYGQQNFLNNLKSYLSNNEISSNINKILKIDDNNSIHKLYKLIYNSKLYRNDLFNTFEHKNSAKTKPTIYKNKVVEIDNKRLTSSYIKSLPNHERAKLIEGIFNAVKGNGFDYPIFLNDDLIREYNNLINFAIDTSLLEVNNNIATGTSICKHFCSKSFYNSKTFGDKSVVEQWSNDEALKRVIENRLGLGWNNTKDETFNITYPELINGFRNSRNATIVSIFKPHIAKYVCIKYSEPGDTIGDYSAGFGARLLGAMCCGRKYIGTDPLTADELNNMINFFKFKDCAVIKSGSENFRGEENSIDLYWSSPPYWNQEVYSDDKEQAYNNGMDYFYDTYWRKTLENIKYMLKPEKWFGVNIKNQPRMLDIAKEYFGDIREQVGLKMRRHPLNIKAGETKLEYVYMFRNMK